MKRVKRCANCIYGSKITGGLITCDYIIMEEHRRPCDPESETYRCEAFKSVKEYSKINRGGTWRVVPKQKVRKNGTTKKVKSE